jgi:uncharacterized membrane protein YhaH (DUF805 family)
MDGNWYVRRGRIGRKTYWLHYALPLTGAYVLATVLDVSLGLSFVSSHTSSYYSYDYYETSYSAMYSAGPIALMTSLALLAPSISALVTRLHDRGHSAHWLWFMLLPIAGPIVLLITAGFLAGDPGPNNYGYPQGAVIRPARKPSWQAPTSV